MLQPGTQLGPYKIVSIIGAGGMGQVYRAVDTRLEREVAVKVLSPALSRDREQLRRFEQEARAAGMLNHPNVLSIYDIGGEDGNRFIVSELLEGGSLRARIREGAIPPRKAIDYAVQIARGLAAAHEKGIVHRDLKPENLFLTVDGQVKILDFGLVKLASNRFTAGDEQSDTLRPGETEPGLILGTVGYMAPEQVRGGGGDHRSDLFSFGAILYEMLTGNRAFRGDSAVESLNAILRDEPADMSEVNPSLPAALERIVRHCLEKNPNERFQSARDVAFDLSSLSGLTSQASGFLPRFRFRARPLLVPALVVLAIGAIAEGAFLVGQRHGQLPPPLFRRLTYRSGTILSARFAPDGESFFYGAKWGGRPVTLFSARPESPESRELGFGTADLLALSPAGQMAISLGRHPIGYLRQSGTLASVPIGGGAPREMLEDVEAADWSPDGRGLCVVRSVAGRSRLEFPIGRVLYENGGWISHPRFSPRGDRIAFLDHPFLNDDRGTVAVVDLAGTKKTLTADWESEEGLAWSPDGREVWFTGSRAGSSSRALRAVALGGSQRLLVSSAGPLYLHDVSPDGHVLISSERSRAGILALLDGDSRERDLSWLDFSVARDLSADGRVIVFSESGEAGGSIYGVYVRSIDGSPAVRLGDGTSESLSPDGRWVLSIPLNQRPSPVVMLPTRSGQVRVVTHDAFNHRNARWMPDGESFLFQGNLPGRNARVWLQSLDGTPPRPLTPENVLGSTVSPDGALLLARGPDHRFAFYPVAGGSPRPLEALHSGDVPVRFSQDGKAIFVSTFGRIPAQLYRVDLGTGERRLWREVMPADPAGLINVGPILVTADGKTIVYSYTRLLSDLYVLENVK
jgi:Tol biopolymer transport system component